MIVKKQLRIFLIASSFLFCCVFYSEANTKNIFNNRLKEFSGLTWDDVCYSPVRREALVNNSLDQWEEIEKRHMESAQDMSYNPEYEADRIDMSTQDVSASPDYMAEFNDPNEYVPEPYNPSFGQSNSKSLVKGKEQQSPFGPSFDKKLAGTSEDFPYFFSMDFGLSYYRYEEPDVMYIKGGMYGLSGEFVVKSDVQRALQGNSHAYTAHVQGSYDWSMGTLHYESKDQAGLETSTNKDYFFDIRALIGRETYYKDNIGFEVYTGLGYRYLKDKPGEQVTPIYDFVKGYVINYLSYVREQSYLYMPFGVNFNIKEKKDYQVTFNLEYDWFLKGANCSHTGDLNDITGPGAESEDANFEQHNGYGLRTSLDFSTFGDKVEFFIKPFMRYWHIQDSEIEEYMSLGSQTAMLEPQNKTYQVGGQIGVRF